MNWPHEKKTLLDGNDNLNGLAEWNQCEGVRTKCLSVVKSM